MGEPEKDISAICFKELSKGVVSKILYAIETGLFEPDNKWMQKAYHEYLKEGYIEYVTKQVVDIGAIQPWDNWYHRIFMMAHSTGIAPDNKARERIEEIKKEIETTYPGLHDRILMNRYYDQDIS